MDVRALDRLGDEIAELSVHLDAATARLLGLTPTPSWGNILSEGRQYIKCCPWITTFSGLAIMLAVLAFNIVGDAPRDLLDPRLRGE
jgi:ABC-type dipeptide/oligopeptide/nickel transport system permease subunit